MKKKFMLVLMVMVMMFVVACGKKDEASDETSADDEIEVVEQKDYYEVGDTVRNDNFELTLNKLEYVNWVGFREGNDDFCMPITEAEKDTQLALGSRDGNVLLFYEYEFKFVGKESIKDYYTYSNGAPVVTYGEYTFAKGFVSFMKGKADKYWVVKTDILEYIVSLDIEGIDYAECMTYRPLEDVVFLVRGVISISEKVKNEPENDVFISFSDFTEEKFIVK